jgi:hypothetical protein
MLSAPMKQLKQLNKKCDRDSLYSMFNHISPKELKGKLTVTYTLD